MATRRGRASGRQARDAMEARRVRERIDGFSAEKEAVFLEELERSGCLADAARVADVSRETVRRHRRHRAAFDAACKLARVKARGPLEAIAWQRAVEGTETKIIRNGKLVEVRVKPSDAMLKNLLAAADPEKYGNRPRATAEQLAAIRQEMEDAQEKIDDAQHQETLRRLVRKLHALRRRRIQDGCGMTLDGDVVPKGYGPVSPDAVPLMENPLDYHAAQDWADFKARSAARAAEDEARGLD